jgi:hypothetical protein
MIPLWLKDLKIYKHGTPVEMFEGLPHDENYCYATEDENIARQRWEDILDKIILGFESYYKIHDEYLYGEDEYTGLNNNYEIGFDLFRKYFSNLWD